MVKALLAHGADLSYQLGTGATVLSHAGKYPAIFSHLCNAGADPTFPSPQTGITAAQEAFLMEESRSYVLATGIDIGGIGVIALIPTHSPLFGLETTEVARIIRMLHRRYPDEVIQMHLHKEIRTTTTFYVTQPLPARSSSYKRCSVLDAISSRMTSEGPPYWLLAPWAPLIASNFLSGAAHV